MAAVFTIAGIVPGCAGDSAGWWTLPLRRTQEFLDTAGLTFTISQQLELAGRTHDDPIMPAVGGLTDLRLHWQAKRARAGAITAVYSAYARSRDLGAPDLQGVSNISAVPFARWREVFYESTVFENVRLKAGKVDANTEFAVVEHAGDLSHASAGVSPTLFTMPSYPDGALSANLFVAPGAGLGAGAGIYRLSGGALYFVGEAGRRWKSRLPGRLNFGAWKRQAGTDGAEAYPASAGSYVVAEQTLLRRAGGALNAFARISIADRAVAPASMHSLYGASWTGFKSRPSDAAGFAYMRLLPSSAGIVLKPESVYETYYKFPLRAGLDMKVDFQHIRLTGGDEGPPCFAVISARLLFTYSAGRKAE